MNHFKKIKFNLLIIIRKDCNQIKRFLFYFAMIRKDCYLLKRFHQHQYLLPHIFNL